ncbi:MAG: succinate dehydrogenase/fumarate reductase cytochrome b subunit [Candidatus Limimorpha sp.]
MKNRLMLFSSVTQKLFMAITGAGFVLFLVFHGTMNLVSIISPEAYDFICETLGANWYAVLASLMIAGLAGLHILIALVLSVENFLARGFVRYKRKQRPQGVSWSSNNMLVLGLLILGGLALHLLNFWYKMQFAELMGRESANGMALVRELFSHPVYSIVYLLWLVVLWLHLSHGVSSMLQSVGWNSESWKQRWRIIGTVVATVIVLLFAAVVIYYWLIYPAL